MQTTSTLNYFTQLGIRTWQQLADLFDTDLFDLVYGDADMLEYADELLWDCITVSELADAHKQLMKESN